MKAIILAAGRGTRLLPLTENRPKCLLEVAGRSLLGWQLWALQEAGIDDVVVVTGFGAAQVDREVEDFERDNGGNINVRTLFNPEWDTADNLVSCLAAREEMDEDFLLLNGDTLIEPEIARRLVRSARVAVSSAVVRKDSYDADDMKVCSGLGWMDHVGKHLRTDGVDGEAIGLSIYRDDGPSLFVEALEDVASQPGGEKRWYLSAVELLALRGLVRTTIMDGLGYAEVDVRADLDRAAELASTWIPEPQEWEMPLRRVASRR